MVSTPVHIMQSAEATSKRRKGAAASRGAVESAPAEEVIQTSFRLPRSRWTKLQQLSIEERLTVQSIIITALESEFARRGRKF